MEDRHGQQLGNYKLLHLVGQGGFADVYLGEHIHLRTQAAIKVLQVRLGDNNIQNFLNEARTIAHLVHPYIVRVLDFGVQDNIPFLVMDYAPNGTFRQRFLQGKPLPAAPLVPYMKQTATALQYGHDKKLIHRDVKPENMLLGSNDEVLLGDFGLALIAYNSISRSLTETAGTAAYMAPEQLQGKPRPASDQYALGMIAYEWLTGSCPFQGSFFEIASQQVLAQPPSLQEKAPGTSPEVEKVVLRALEKDPQQRFPNVREFALALEDACLDNKQYSFELPINQNLNKTNLNMPINAPESIVDHSFASPSPASNPLERPLSAEAASLVNNQQDMAAQHEAGITSEKRPHTLQPTAQNKQQQAPEQPAFPSAQNSFSMSNRIQPPANNVSFRDIPPISVFQVPNQSSQLNSLTGQPSLTDQQIAQMNFPIKTSQPKVQPEQFSQNNNASFSMAAFPSEQAPPFNPPPDQFSRSGVYTFPTGQGQPPLVPPMLSSAFPSGPQPSPQKDSISFADFPPLIEPQLPNLIEGEWSGMQPAQANTFIPDLTASQKLQRVTLNRLKAVATPIYKDHQFRPTNMLVIIIVIFVIVGSSIGILTLANTQKAAHQQSTTPNIASTATSLARATQGAKATQTAQAVLANANPYLATGGGTLTFNDPLTSNKNAWQVGPDATGVTAGQCTITNQGYQVDAPSLIPTPCMQTTQSFTNFTYQVDLTLTAVGQSYGGGGIIFRSSSDSTQYYFFEVFSTGNYSLQKCTELGCANYMDGYKLGKAPTSAFKAGINETNTLAVIANGNDIQLFVNKQKVSELTDQVSAPYASGAIGVLATAGNDSGLDTATNTATTAIFSNAKVWKF
jgi:serine/threonine protein kinase